MQYNQFSSVQLNRSVLSDSLWPHELQHATSPCPSPIHGVYSNSCRLSQWCHPTISSFVIPFSSCLQSFPESGSFQVSQLFASSGQSIGVSASASVLTTNTQGWFHLGWTGWISWQSKGLSRVFSTILDVWGWCTGTTQRDGMGREEGGGFRMGNTRIPVADSFWYLAKQIQLCKV